MPRYRLTLEYDGGPFAGWQRQEGQSSVQGEIEEAIFKLSGERVTVTGAGRTDAGLLRSGTRRTPVRNPICTEDSAMTFLFPRRLAAALSLSLALLVPAAQAASNSGVGAASGNPKPLHTTGTNTAPDSIQTSAPPSAGVTLRRQLLISHHLHQREPRAIPPGRGHRLTYRVGSPAEIGRAHV